jgi:hypothetical protein
MILAKKIKGDMTAREFLEWAGWEGDLEEGLSLLGVHLGKGAQCFVFFPDAYVRDKDGYPLATLMEEPANFRKYAGEDKFSRPADETAVCKRSKIVYVDEILRELGVPEKSLGLEIQLAELVEPVEVYSGNSAEGYHGYHAGYTVYDPHSQLTTQSKNASSQYVNESVTTFAYKGERPAAVKYHIWDAASNWDENKILLFVPEDTKIIFRAQKKEPIQYSVPPRLLEKWIKQVSAEEKRDPKRWYEYERVQRKVWRKGLVYAAYAFAQEYPNEVGIAEGYGRPILVQNGAVEFVDFDDAQPKMLLRKYGVKAFHPIEIDE